MHATTSENSTGPCARCGSPATRSCFLSSARSLGGAAPGGAIDGDASQPIEDHDLEVQQFFVCERCIGAALWRRRYVGFSGGGLLVFLGGLAFLSADDRTRALGVALAFAGLIWVGWTILDTWNARDDAAEQIAREEALARSPRAFIQVVRRPQLPRGR